MNIIQAREAAMEVSDGEVKRWEIKATKWDNPKAEWRFHDSEGPGFPGYDSPPPCIKVMRVEDHERIVAELKEKLEVFRNREYGFENELELKQTIARQSRVIEKLKVINRDFAWHYDECSSIDEDNAPCDCGLRKTRTEIATIEQGEGT